MAPTKEQAFARPDGVAQPTNLTDNESYVGSFWVRQQVRVSAAQARQGARLLLGTLFDADYTYVNGTLVGNTAYQYPPRRYTLPAGLLTEGANTLSIRFVTHSRWPHFIPEKPYKNHLRRRHGATAVTRLARAPRQPHARLSTSRRRRLHPVVTLQCHALSAGTLRPGRGGVVPG